MQVREITSENATRPFRLQRSPQTEGSVNRPSHGAGAMPWYRDRIARSLILFRYLPAIAALNLAWESAHVPLYTVWTERTAGYVAYAVVHCTVADVLVAGASLALALVLTRAADAARWRWATIVFLTILIGVAFTALSEWLNTSVLAYWAYRDLMPVVRLFGVQIGVSPLAQWLLLPPLALCFARRGLRQHSPRALQALRACAGGRHSACGKTGINRKGG